MDMQTELFYLPPLAYFQFGNAQTGSCGSLSYKVSGKEELLLQLWHGRLCSDKAKIEEEHRYPMEQESLSKIKELLESKKDGG